MKIGRIFPFRYDEFVFQGCRLCMIDSTVRAWMKYDIYCWGG